jgi:hypothetical protein
MENTMEQLEFLIRQSVDELSAYIDKKSAQELIVGFVLLYIDIDRIHGQDHITSKHYWEELLRLNNSSLPDTFKETNEKWTDGHHMR